VSRRRTAAAASSEDEAVRLFAWRASDARGDRELSASELAVARRIVRALGCNRLGVLAVAARCAADTVEDVERGLATLSELVAPDADLRAALMRGARLREQGKLARAETELRGAISKKKRDYAGLADVHRIRHLPCTIVHGRYDVVTPVKSAWDLSRVWPEAMLRIVPDAGHAMTEPGIVHELVSATRRQASLG
jgi:pimeloyl-ACP methyl ester carboxylesterase